MRLALCGDLTVTRDGEALTGPRLGTRKARVFVAALAGCPRTPRSPPTASPRPSGRTDPPRDPQANLATLASRLRKVVGDGFVEPGARRTPSAAAWSWTSTWPPSWSPRPAPGWPAASPRWPLSAASRALDLLGESEELAEECEGDWADGLRHRATELRREARHVRAAAATTTGQTDLARASAAAAVDTDPYDERAHRDLMAALAHDGRATAALELYAALAARLADELGTDPDPETQRLHLAVLRGEPVGGDRDDAVPAAPGGARRPRGGARAARPGLDRGRGGTAVPGRRAPASRASARPACWPSSPSWPQPAAAWCSRPGAGPASARCSSSRSSRCCARSCSPCPRRPCRSLLGGHLAAWTRLLPELGELFGLRPRPRGLPRPGPSPVLRRRRGGRRRPGRAPAGARRARRRPVRRRRHGRPASPTWPRASTRRRCSSWRPSRTDGLPRLPQLTASRDPLLLGPIPPSAVDALASAAGFGGRADEVQARSRGHPLSVVASLQSLASGTDGVPARPRRRRRRPARPARARSRPGSWLPRRSSAPASSRCVLAGLVDRPEVEVVLTCEAPGPVRPDDRGRRRLRLRQRPRAGGRPRRPCPEPLRVAFHRRAADLIDRPAGADGARTPTRPASPPARRAATWRPAGRRGGWRRSTTRSPCWRSPSPTPRPPSDASLAATVLLERARAHEARTDYAAAEGDLLAARATLAGVPRAAAGDAEPAAARRRHPGGPAPPAGRGGRPQPRPGWVSRPSSATRWPRPCSGPGSRCWRPPGSGSPTRSTWRPPA